jgi:hypothetical protein
MTNQIKNPNIDPEYSGWALVFEIDLAFGFLLEIR